MKRIPGKLASLRLTLLGFAALGAALVVDQKHPSIGGWVIAAALGLLAANLVGALFVDPRFRHRPALFGFHVGLLLLTALAGYGQLYRYEGRLALVEGQLLEPGLLETQRAGPLARASLPPRSLQQAAIEVDYSPGIVRGATRSRVWTAERGWLEIGDDVPVRIDGYRLYTTSNKGFAALLTWYPEEGGEILGAVHFPSYPVSELAQTAAWATPRGQELVFHLELPPSGYSEHWTLMAAHADGVPLILTLDGRRTVMQPGTRLRLDGGSVEFHGTAMWMGYKVFHEPALPWMFSVATLCVVLMGAHFSTRVFPRRPRTVNVTRSRVA